MADHTTLIAPPSADPLWYKDAIIYEIHVRAFLDSNADGIGDFRGLTQKLDYLQNLGVTALWLLPFYPSPLKDDGYDIADYYSINPIYGTLGDFKEFLHEAHQRGLRVITELVVNHTSDQHPWFQRARTAKPGTPWREYYVWSDRADKYREARIIFRDFEPSNWTWDPIAKAYYWHRFYSHQPDLNYDNPQVHKEISRVLEFWLDLGVDGLRLDAVPYLYEREGTSCENLSETHQYLKSLRQHLDQRYGDRMLLAEANQWPEEAISYFGSGRGDECHMAFHFPLMPRIFMAVRLEDRVPIVDILEQTPTIPETSQWALFLRNHDELTLEMVTDEERDYMYRVYANDVKARINLGIRRRLAPLLGNDRKRIELLHLLLFSLPGTPVLYYGDEIGMGDNIFLGDRNGVRTPMQWSSDKNAGFSRASPQALYLPIILDPEYHYEAVNVEVQQINPHSLFWWMKRVLTLRKRYRAFGRGSLQFLQPENRKILAFIRRYESETLLVVTNLSRFPQPVQLDLSEFRQSQPVELFGRTDFPPITDKPYLLTLGPHAVFWFSLEAVAPRVEAAAPHRRLELFRISEKWEELFEANGLGKLEACLASFLQYGWPECREEPIKALQIRDVAPMPMNSSRVLLLFLALDYGEGDPQEYLLPVSAAWGDEALKIEQTAPVIARLQHSSANNAGVLYVAEYNRRFWPTLLQAMAGHHSFQGAQGEARAFPAAGLDADASAENLDQLEPAANRTSPTTTSVVLGDKFFLKLFRHLLPGINPDLELSQFLTERGFPQIAPLAGAIQYHRNKGEQYTLGVVKRFVPNAQNAWTYSLEMLSRYFDRILTVPDEGRQPPQTEGSLLELAHCEVPESVVALLGTYLELARLLGQRTGQLHLALASSPTNPDFAPESFTPFYQRALYQSMRNLTVRTLQNLRRSLDRVPARVRAQAERAAQLEPEILKRLRAIHETPLSAQRIRCHGDFHLARIYYTGKDFAFFDFEGQVGRSLGERRIKRCALRDVAGMIRSFDYVTHAALLRQLELGALREEHLPQLEPWTAFWHRWVSAVYLKAYLEVADKSELLPQTPSQMELLLETHLLEKAIDEVGFELRHRPYWVEIPLRAILQSFEPALAAS